MTIAPAQFLLDFPEFSADGAGAGYLPKYPQSTIQFYLDWAYLSLPSQRWSTLLDKGAELFVAHYIVLEAKAKDAIAQGGEPGLATGIIASTGVGPVNVSYDTSTPANPADGELNLTEYGQRFARLRNQFGAGGLAVPGCGFPAGAIGAGGFWTGGGSIW